MRFAMNMRITIHKISTIAISARYGCGKLLEIRLMFPRSSLSVSSARVQRFTNCKNGGFEFSRRLSDYGAGFVLGNAEIRLVDLAGAYAGLARNGVAMRAKLLSAEHHPVTRIASREATEIINDILCDNSAREKSFGAHSPLAFEERVAVKTGTSSGFRDAWTVGFNKEHTIAVWAGNPNGQPMRDTFAVRSATPLWAAMMHDLLQRDHPLDAPRENEKLARREICAQTGLLPSFRSVTKINELFLKGTEPKGDSSAWFSEDGKLSLPNEYADWCASGNNTSGAQVRTRTPNHQSRCKCPIPN